MLMYLLSIGETKLGDSFPEGQFLLEGYAVEVSSATLIFLLANQPTLFKFKEEMRIIPIELRKQKWVFFLNIVRCPTSFIQVQCARLHR